MGDCAEVLKILSQELEDGLSFPRFRIFDEINCQGTIRPKIRETAIVAKQYTCKCGPGWDNKTKACPAIGSPCFNDKCNDNPECADCLLHCDLWSGNPSIDDVNETDFFCKSMYIPPGFTLDFSGGDIWIFKADICGYPEVNCCVKQEECTDFGKWGYPYASSGNKIGPVLFTTVLDFNGDDTLGNCEQIKQAIKGGPPRFSISATGGRGACLNGWSVTPKDFTLTNTWPNLAAFKVALCMGRIVNDPYMPDNWKPQTATCDDFMTQLCQTEESLFTEECSCLRQTNAISLKFNITNQSDIGTTAACFTSTCKTANTYQTGNIKDSDCNVTICSEFIELNGDSIVASGQNEIVCDGKTYQLGGAESSPIPVPSETAKTGFNTTELAIVIGIAVIYVGLFVYWLYRFLRNKFSH